MSRNTRIASPLLAAVLGGTIGLIATTPAQADITTGLVAHWGFEEGSGSTSTADTTTSGSVSDTATFWPGMLVNPPQSPHYVTGRVGNYALDLDADDNTTQPLPFLKVSASSDLTTAITNSYTISGWFNLAHEPTISTSPNQTNPGLFNSRSGNASNNFDLQIVKANPGPANAAWTGLHADIGSGSNWLDTGANVNHTFLPNTWYMVTYVVQVGQADIYVNGSSVGTVTWSGTDDPVLMASNSTLDIGAGAGGTGNHLPGLIDDARIYNRALSSSDVAELYAAAPAPEPASAALLLLGLGGLLMLPRRRKGSTCQMGRA